MTEVAFKNTNSIELTIHEAELYDRQIRLWGLESQKRIRAARILICGLNGLGAEISKNVILAGVKSVTFLDHNVVSEADRCSQFLVPVTTLGQNRAEASLARAQALNPMVELKADQDILSAKPDNFFTSFDVVIVIGAPRREMIRINNACRMKGVKFFATDVWGLFGYCFADLQEHNFIEDVFKHKIISKENDKVKTELVAVPTKKTLLFPPLQDVFEFDCCKYDYIKAVKRKGFALVMFLILHRFREEQNRDPCFKETSEDHAILLQYRDEVVPGIIPDSAFTHLYAQISPAAAIVGGVVGQEVIKSISQKEAPHHNLFFFDPERGDGYIETIGI
ncbi:SUMO-activating enzyme subunit 1 [Phlebotomus argentipes]|uniref:SUMO-activating enzyme subunit 1 n=1 Tax=Phlebotomus argentipes TaxID=94469 RepID=UPI00289371A8|nr:SUMO-activating enzyme subunit 1 [Phlebotomus argentipes]